MDAVTKVKNLNEAQHAYAAHKRQAQQLIRSISGSLIDQPAACNGNWSLVGEMEHLVNQLKEIEDRLNGTGEYAR